MSHPLGNLLLLEKPARYIGSEFNEVKKDPNKVKLRVGLLYPEIYEIGMSNFGLKIIYHVFNSYPEVFAERIFLPWVDAVEYMKKENIPLFTLETLTPVNSLDVLGISLHTELNYTNFLLSLDLSGIPLSREERSEKVPIVMVGGPCTLNPSPLEPFADFFVVGEGEDVVRGIIPYLLEYKERKITKEELLNLISKLDGIYVPGNSKITRRAIAFFEDEDFPIDQIVPNIEIVHHRYVVEVMRGCTRGCRFCQGGFNYRPLRVREPEDVLKLAFEGVKRTGFDEVGLLAFSISDYPYLSELVRAFKKYLKNTHISLPSLPIDSLDESLLEEFEDLRRFGITLAPEVASEKLRKVINKNVPLESIFRTLSIAHKYHFPHVKLYLMVGLPGEEESDIEEMGRFLKEIATRFKRIQFKASVSPFVPRAHTPFQYVEQEDLDRIYEKLGYLKKLTRDLRNLSLSYHDPKMSFIEGVFGRGDSKLAEVLVEAYREGAIFDSRNEFFDFDKYRRAFGKLGIDPKEYTRARNPEESQPWEVVDSGIYTTYFRREFEKSVKAEYTSNCAEEGCLGCGVWIKEGYRICRDGLVKEKKEIAPQVYVGEEGSGRIAGYLLGYKISKGVRFISQRDLSKIIVNLLRASGVNLKYSEGYVPHPRISMPNPLPLGTESEEEYIYFESEEILNPDKTLKNLNGLSMDGLEFFSLKHLDKKPDWKALGMAKFEVVCDDFKNSFTLDLTSTSLFKFLKEKHGLDREQLYLCRIKKLEVVKKQ